LIFSDFRNPASEIITSLPIDNIEPLIKWKSSSNYCFDKQTDSEKIYKFFNQVFKAEKTLSKIKILELAKPLFSLWCKGKEAAESYFTILDQLANKDARLLTAITRADLPYHHHTETEVEEMIKQFVAFLDSIYSIKELVLTPGRPRRPWLSLMAMKKYHTKSLLNLMHKLVGELFGAPPGDYEVHDTDEKPPSQQKNVKLMKPKKRKEKKIKRHGRQRHGGRSRDDDEEEDEEEEEDRRDHKRNKPRRKRKVNKKRSGSQQQVKKGYNYKDEQVRKRLDYLLEEVNKKPVLENKGVKQVGSKVPSNNQRK
jgi:hypothetical protein